MGRLPDIVWKETEEYKKTLAEAEKIRGERRRRRVWKSVLFAAAALIFVGCFTAALVRAGRADALAEKTLGGLEWEAPLSADFQEDIFHGEGERYGLKTVKRIAKREAFYEEDRTLYGVATAGGESVIPAEYDDISAYPEERYFLVRKESSEEEEVWRYLDWTGGGLTKETFLYAQAFSGDYAVAQKAEGLWVVIDRTGAELLAVDCENMDCVNPERGWFSVQKNCEKVLSGNIVTTEELRTGVIDIAGREILPFEYEEIRSGGEGMLIVEALGSPYYSYLNEELQDVIGRTFDDARPFSEGLACVREWDETGSSESEKRTFIDKEGNPVFTLSCDEAGDFSEGLALIVKADRQIYCVDQQGKAALPDCGKARGESIRLMGVSFYLYDLQKFSEGLVVYQDENSLFGYMDAAGRIVVAPVFGKAGDFENGSAEVMINGKTGRMKNPLK